MTTEVGIEEEKEKSSRKYEKIVEKETIKNLIDNLNTVE